MGGSVVAMVGYFVLRSLSRPVLTYFTRAEFGVWWFFMSPKLLKKLDGFRHNWGYPVEISKHADAIGREIGESLSQHNISRWGEVRAIDVFPMLPNDAGGFRYINTKSELKAAYDLALSMGFTGVGVYLDTVAGYMLHLDVRETESVATWSRIDGEYLAAGEAFV
jgi:hypothetical protein